MSTTSNAPGCNVIQLDAARQRRHYINVANNSVRWLHLRAALTATGRKLGDDDAERFGRIEAGDATLDPLTKGLLGAYAQGEGVSQLSVGADGKMTLIPILT